MIGFRAALQKFDQQGEKTGWTYFVITKSIAEKIKPGFKKSFRVKGKIDELKISQVAILPMGDGNFIMPVNGAMRKVLKKQKGALVQVELQEDKSALSISPGLMTCLQDEPEAMAFFNALPGSHRQYYSKWIESAKTDPTKTKRIAMVLTAFINKLSYAEMLRLGRRDQ